VASGIYFKGRLGLLDMSFRTIFEATPSQYFLAWFPVLGLTFVLVGVLMVLKPQVYLNFVFSGAGGSWGKIPSWAWLVFWSLWTAVTFPAAIGWWSIPQSEPSTIVEGRVTNFVRMPYNGPSHGSFVVAGKQFTWSAFGLKPISVEGSIADGVYARVTFRERPINRIEILRLEVADPN
jgi:hypothetical protein